MKRKTPVNVSASVRARLLKVSKERREDFTLTLRTTPLSGSCIDYLDQRTESSSS